MGHYGIEGRIVEISYAKLAMSRFGEGEKVL